MEITWRTPLKQYINEHYIQDPQHEWFSTHISTTGLLSLTIISNRFKDLPLQQRREQIWEMLQQLNAPTETGFLSLYTVNEAKSIQLTPPSIAEEKPVYNWFNLTEQVVNSEKAILPQREPRVPRTIAFYAFKGGVGRTTALAHVAAILVRRGRRVVTVDLDLEAPGLGSAFGLTPLPQKGIVDYFYERAYIPEGIEPIIAVTDIFSEVHFSDAPGRLFVVPTGTLDLDYIAKVDDLRPDKVNAQGEDLWSIFYREINEQLHPDVILVDSRTGFNEWGAFSLLRAADKAIIFLYPNEQNKQGIDLLMQALSGRLPTYFVFSPVPLFGGVGQELVKRQWETLQTGYQEQNNDEQGNKERESNDERIADPIIIPYTTAIALADTYPVSELEGLYIPIANIIDEETTISYLSNILSNSSGRKYIIETLDFPVIQANAHDNPDLDRIFQRTADFDKLLDNTTCLVHGRKGTGKSALYYLLLRHNEKARELARGRLEHVRCFSGHGGFNKRPTRNEFQRVANAIEQHKSSWEEFWRYYLLMRLHMYDLLPPRGKNDGANKFGSLRSQLNSIPRGFDAWNTEYLNILLNMLTHPELDTLAKDMLSELDVTLQQKQEYIWLLYDDLDVDLKGTFQEEALIGLFQLIQAADARKLTAIRFKIFLREDIWERLIFPNKSHFNGRYILLEWTRLDFLRLALRQALLSEEFKKLVDRFSPIQNVEQADEESVEKALQLLWGSRLTKNPKSGSVSTWVYNRLTDSKTTFPRSLNILLRAAKEAELTKSERPPTDRLLRSNALTDGLIEASNKRCQELREEYHEELGAFFDHLSNVNMLVTDADLQGIWEATVKATYPAFENFIKTIQDIGLLGKRGADERYRFAEIYTYGFGMNRRTGYR